MIVKVVPIPSVLSTSIVPLCASTMALAREVPVRCLGYPSRNGAVKAFEDMMEILGMDAATIVLHDNLNQSGHPFPVNGDAIAGLGVIEGHFL